MIPVGHPDLGGKVEIELLDDIVLLLAGILPVAGCPAPARAPLPPLRFPVVALSEQPHRRVPVKVLVVLGRADRRERRPAVLDGVPHRGQLRSHRRGRLCDVVSLRVRQLFNEVRRCRKGTLVTSSSPET